jgi:trimethylamine--corrinoid protein Co-methyltransferase
MKPEPLKVLSDAEIQKIHANALEILQHTGITVNLKKMRALLADHGCQVEESSRIVKFPPGMVETFLAKAPGEFVIGGADPETRFPMGPDKRVWAGLGTAFRMLDPIGGAHREATHADTEAHLILLDYLENVSCNQMDVWAQDIDMHTVHVEAIRSWALNCTKSFGMGAYGVMATTDMMEMVALAVGGKDELRERHPFCGIVSIESPLSTSQMQLEGMMILGEHDAPALVSPEAMAGTTAPVTLAGLLQQHHTEIISHVVMAQVAHPGCPVIYGSVSTIADMKTGTPALGAVETGLISAASAQLGHFNNLPVRAVAGATDAKVPDVQCGFERAQSMLLAAMAGVNYITCVGTLESTNLGAHEMAVIDNEIIGRVERALRGIDIDDKRLCVGDIRDTGPGGNYLMAPMTLQYFREEHFIPKLSDRNSMEAWTAAGGSNIVDHAAAEVERLLAAHQPRQLDEKRVAELDRYVEIARKRSLEDFEAAEWEG